MFHGKRHMSAVLEELPNGVPKIVPNRVSNHETPKSNPQRRRSLVFMSVTISIPVGSHVPSTPGGIIPLGIAPHVGVEIGVAARQKVIALLASIGPWHGRRSMIVWIRIQVIPS